MRSHTADRAQDTALQGAPVLSWPAKSRNQSAVRSAQLREIYGHGEELGKLIHGDSLDTLNWLLASGYQNAVDLVYIDPPFGGGALYNRKIQLRGADHKASFTAPAYQDFWSDAEYLQFMYERLLLIKDLLNDNGSLYLHVDTSQAHYLKVICDEIFGRENFQREIVWRIGWVSGYKTQAKNWIRNHDTILFYTKHPDDFFFEKQYVPYAANYRRRGGKKPTGKGHPIEDTWNCSEQDKLDSIQIKSFSNEKTGYPTQKNEKLLARIIGSSCPEGGLVLDCFSGSGTTASVAQCMSRRWLAADINPEAIHTARMRLLSGGGQLASSFGIYSFIEQVQSPPSATVIIERSSSNIEVAIESFDSPAVRCAMKKKKAVADWKSIVDGVLMDWNYDGKAFRIDFADVPAKPEHSVKGKYRFSSAGRVAVKIIDVLGNEHFFVETDGSNLDRSNCA